MQDYAFREFRNRVGELDWTAWGSARPDLRKAYVLCMLSELAYEFIPKWELESSGRLKLIPCNRYLRSLQTGDRLAVETWENRTIDGEIPRSFQLQVIQGRMFNAAVIGTPVAYFIAFRGTKPFYMSDWRINLRARLHDPSSPGTHHRGLFHLGFLHEVLRLVHRLAPIMRPALDNKLPVYVTGHSLGGALAGVFFALYGEDWLGCGLEFEREFRLTGAYIFSSPRFSDQPCDGSSSHAQAFHFRTKGDPVPFLPPRIGWGYSNPIYEFDGRGRRISRTWEWISPMLILAILPVRLHDISRLRKRIGREVGADPGLDLLPAKSPEREAALMSM